MFHLLRANSEHLRRSVAAKLQRITTNVKTYPPKMTRLSSREKCIGNLSRAYNLTIELFMLLIA